MAQAVELYAFESEPDYDLLLANIGEARYVCIGDGTHGTKEFYQIRAELTKRLIVEKQFTAVLLEGDWPSVYALNACLADPTKGEEEALSGFTRFPSWLWKNAETLAFLEWLKHYQLLHQNDIPYPINLYGIDLYSVETSLQEVDKYFKSMDPSFGGTPYPCLSAYQKDIPLYGYLVHMGLIKRCEDEATQRFLEIAGLSSQFDGDKKKYVQYFNCLQNARLIKNAEQYYAAMFQDSVLSWNIRDRHMMETIESITAYLQKQNKTIPKLVIWAHNSHVGDERATDRHKMGQINLGQLLREHYDNQTYHIGFLTYSGEVLASSKWGESPKRQIIVPALLDSYEAAFHQLGLPQFLLFTHNREIGVLAGPKLHRAIGVVYQPKTERQSHYYTTHLALQFDAICYLDITKPITPLEEI